MKNFMRSSDLQLCKFAISRFSSCYEAGNSYPNIAAVLLELPRGVNQQCYKKKAATVGQNGRLSALCNFFSF